MDSKSLERFNHILTKEIGALSQDEVSFLRARRESLNPIQKQFYAEILNETSKVEVVETESTEEPKKPTRKKVTK